MSDRDAIRSSFCADGSCVEVDICPNVVYVGNDNSEYIAFTREEWAAFIAGVKAGEFDL